MASKQAKYAIAHVCTYNIRRGLINEANAPVQEFGRSKMEGGLFGENTSGVENHLCGAALQASQNHKYCMAI